VCACVCAAVCAGYKGGTRPYPAHATCSGPTCPCVQVGGGGGAVAVTWGAGVAAPSATFTDVVLRDNTLTVVVTGDRAGALAVGGAGVLVQGTTSNAVVQLTRCALLRNTVHLRDDTDLQVVVMWGGGVGVVVGVDPGSDSVLVGTQVVAEDVAFVGNSLQQEDLTRESGCMPLPLPLLSAEGLRAVGHMCVHACGEMGGRRLRLRGSGGHAVCPMGGCLRV
jgi:hypothetical protein